MVEVIWTEPALEDLNALAEYMALDKPQPASDLVRCVFAHIELLSAQPGLGPVVPELRPNSRYRQIVEAPCRIFYRHEKKARRLYILGVIRGERLYQKRLIQQRDKQTGK